MQKYHAIFGFGCIFAGSLTQLMGVTTSIKGEINVQMNMFMIGLAIVFHISINGLTAVIKHYADQNINKVMIPRLYKLYQDAIERENEKNRSVEVTKSIGEMNQT